MSSSRYERAREIFDRAEALPAGEREDFLREACGGDSGLREQVDSLLDAHRRMGDFLEDPAPTWTGQRIDRFTVERVLAEGGMGIVLQASQDHPRRTVAMKLIRGSRLSETSVQRFVMEAEALGRLDHPGIARIYEAGMAEREDRSFPYFVMELIEGLPLLEFARRRDLGEAERLELMIDICEAVHHAHLRGVIHRDLKPSNILVRGDGQPKVLDFGVARITDADVQLTTVNTQVGQVLGTLPYMSPEQVRGDNEALDLRSDVYALGVLTFEILTGRLPQPLHRTELVEAVRMITQDSPDSLGDSSRSFDADLETIAAKCLQKEPAERYSSALDLATDLRRYLDHEPITARPPSLVYQIRRFARRNRVVVAWAVTSLVLLLGGLAVSLAGWSTAHQERDRALASAREATELSDLLVDLLSSPDPRQDGADVRVRDLLEVASERADSALSDHPRAAARLHQALGLSYRGLGLHRQARAELTQAVIRARELPPDRGAASVVEALLDLSNLTFEMGQAEVTDSLLTAVEERLDGAGEEPELRFRLSLQRGMRARQQRQLESAETQLRQASTEAEQILGADHPVSRDLVSELAYTLWSQGRADEAAQLFERSLASDTRIHGPDHPATLKSANNLGRMYQQLGNLDRAQELLHRTLDAKIRRLGPNHPSTGTGHHNLGLVLHDMGELDEALDHHLLAVAIADSFLTHEDSRWAHSHAALAKTRFAREEFGEARRHYELSLEFLEERYGIEHPELQRICGELATSCVAVGDLDAARRWRARVLADE